MKKYSFPFLILILFTYISCRENSKNATANIKKKEIIRDTIAKLKEVEKITISELKSFHKKTLNICKTSENDIGLYISDDVRKSYPNFRKMFNTSYSQKDGEVLFEIDNGIGIITINSIEFIESDGQKHRNEYSTFFYVIKRDNELIINEVGGAG